MTVYMVSHVTQYEGSTVLGIFSDYAKAHAFELEYAAKEDLCDPYEWVDVRKVELDKVYGYSLAGAGEEV